MPYVREGITSEFLTKIKRFSASIRAKSARSQAFIGSAWLQPARTRWKPKRKLRRAFERPTEVCREAKPASSVWFFSGFLKEDPRGSPKAFGWVEESPGSLRIGRCAFFDGLNPSNWLDEGSYRIGQREILSGWEKDWGLELFAVLATVLAERQFLGFGLAPRKMVSWSIEFCWNQFDLNKSLAKRLRQSIRCQLLARENTSYHWLSFLKVFQRVRPEGELSREPSRTDSIPRYTTLSKGDSFFIRGAVLTILGTSARDPDDPTFSGRG